ncbi:MAG TPA: M56 family metallopeptidase [Candidatus Acidoferrales bacterium]|nr:M56 family metallopeptidase [Candidatus Acidoferrales bacterium]
MSFSGSAATATVVSGQNVTLAMAGLFRPQILVSRKVLADLSAEQLDAALNHERAHRRSMDNFKRLILMLCPEFAPFRRAFGRLEAEWRRVSEWAADDAASAGDPDKAVALAEALVRVARISASEQLSPLCSTLVPGRADLAERVERLLNPQAAIVSGPLPWKRIALPASVVFTLALILIISRPTTLQFVHDLLERMTH